jgi:D-sedoheptulose 7-phosphate isomerase
MAIFRMFSLTRGNDISFVGMCAALQAHSVGAVSVLPGSSEEHISQLRRIPPVENERPAQEGLKSRLAIDTAAGNFSRMFYAIQHLRETAEIAAKIDAAACGRCVARLRAMREAGGRLFILGVGGSAANASHAVNDFRKIAGIEAYAPTDNVSELTARTNDEGWASVFVEWLRVSRLGPKDCLLILSVGGGDAVNNVSPNLVAALQLAKQVGAGVIGIVGKDGGYTARVADAVVLVPTVNPGSITPHTEAFQAVVWHLFVSHPDLKVNQTKWESVAAKP